MFYKYVKELVSRSKSISEQHLSVNGNISRLSSGFPSTYSDLKVRVSFGQGNWAAITWIGFLTAGQEIQQGIYPVFLYYRSINTLILAYGISATYTPLINWQLQDPKTIGDYFRENNITASRKYDKSFVYKVYPGDTIDESIDQDLDDLIKIYKQQLNSRATHVNEPKRVQSDSQSNSSLLKTSLINRVINTIQKSGLIFNDQFVSRFVISLLTKPFVILSGLSGSGKTQLAIAFAKAISADANKQVCIVPVGADWTNREPLLGYPNALESEKYVRPESGVLQLIQNAIGDKLNPYFLILDEMNLSYVERYFADFLSSLESHSPIPLWDKNTDGVPMHISLPPNLFIVGTINVDETTYMFSPKVLDRANVIEFKIDLSEMDSYLKVAPFVDLDKIEGSIADIASEFVTIAKTPVKTDFKETNSLLLVLFKALKSVNAEFGYRSASEIGRFIALAKEKGNLTLEKAVDAAIVQKLLPKLHGSRKKLVPVLTILWEMCDTGIKIEQADRIPEQTKYTLTADKLLRMYHGAIDNGFTSFAEA